MRCLSIAALATLPALALLLPVRDAAASTTLLSDNFETYSPGTLNKNVTAAPNAAPNGSGNPWWGALGGRLTPSTIVGAEGGITPHSGSQMVAGASSNSTQSVLWDNIAYRFNGGDPVGGNLTMTYWFYDPNGASNGINFAGYGGIAYYNTNSATADYPDSQTLNSSTTVDRLSLGGASYTRNTAGYPQTYNASEYQARVVGSALGYTSNGWINLPMTRSIGWHEAEIAIGAPNSDGFNPISFYIDDLSTPLLSTTSTIGRGYTDLELSSGPDSSSSATNAGAWFDDVTLTQTPEPTSLTLFAGAGLSLFYRRQRRS